MSEPNSASPEPEDEVPGYVAPAQKSLDTILQTDEDDEALKKYKAALLGSAATGDRIVVDQNNPNNVIVKKLALIVDGRPDMELDLTEDLAKIKKKSFAIKEGIQFRIRIDFFVQREIVAGLKYVQKTSRLGVTVDKMTHMVGSYAPKKELQSYTTPWDDAPSGMAGRGTYSVSSLFTDDDKKEYLKWGWHIEIKKDW